MKHKQIIQLSLILAVVVGIGIAAWHLAFRHGLTAPIALVEIPAGEFLMGSPETEEGHEDDETQHHVKITYAFKMGKTEVTQKQWREVMGTTIRQQRDLRGMPSVGERISRLYKGMVEHPKRFWDESSRVGSKTVLMFLVGNGGDQSLCGEGDFSPMYYVSWEDATEFCARLTEPERTAGRLPGGQVYRLPTEAEWEYACRAGSTTRFANGDTEGDLDKIAWYCDNSDSCTHHVGTKTPNDWGAARYAREC